MIILMWLTWSSLVYGITQVLSQVRGGPGPVDTQLQQTKLLLQESQLQVDSLTPQLAALRSEAKEREALASYKDDMISKLLKEVACVDDLEQQLQEARQNQPSSTSGSSSDPQAGNISRFYFKQFFFNSFWCLIFWFFCGWKCMCFFI